MSEVPVMKARYAPRRRGPGRPPHNVEMKYLGRSVMFDAEQYRVEALEQIGCAQPFSARLYAPPDRITPYTWIQAWITTETWAEALMAAKALQERVMAGLPLGEHESLRHDAR